MATSDRPSGLTALAVINFILSFMQLLSMGSLLLARYVRAPHAVGNSHIPEGQAAQLAALAEVPTLTIVILCSLLGISGVLLFVTAFGFLHRKRRFGKHATTLYVINDLTYVACLIAMMPEAHIRGLGISLIRTVFYPIFVGTLVHTVFRRDLVR